MGPQAGTLTAAIWLIVNTDLQLAPCTWGPPQNAGRDVCVATILQHFRQLFAQKF